MIYKQKKADYSKLLIKKILKESKTDILKKSNAIQI